MKQCCVRIWMLGALITHVVVPGVFAQASRLCFNVPGITQCIEGRFREFWEQNGGLPVFGYPLTEALQHTTAEGSFLTQYFERNRFELHPASPRPYDVLLGRLGDDRLKQQGRRWQTFPKGQPSSNCIWFAETEHSVCEPFKIYWENQGLQDPALIPFARALALFGLPLSEPRQETNSSGDTVLTQWFERARFEYHPSNPIASHVLLGLLGRETVTGPGQLSRNCSGIEAPQRSVIQPSCVKYGTGFRVTVTGFSPNEAIGYWITRCCTDAATIGSRQSVRTTSAGEAVINVNTNSFFGNTIPTGDYVFVAQDVAQRQPPAQAPFRVIGSTATLPPSLSNCRPDPYIAEAPYYPIIIAGIDKRREIIVLANVSATPVDIGGWIVCSFNGQEMRADMSGTLLPGEARAFPPADGREIWKDSEDDSGALYTPEGLLVSYWKD